MYGKKDIKLDEQLPLGTLELWDGFSNNIQVWSKSLLKNCDVKIMLKGILVQHSMVAMGVTQLGIGIRIMQKHMRQPIPNFGKLIITKTMMLSIPKSGLKIMQDPFGHTILRSGQKIMIKTTTLSILKFGLRIM